MKWQSLHFFGEHSFGGLDLGTLQWVICIIIYRWESLVASRIGRYQTVSGLRMFIGCADMNANYRPRIHIIISQDTPLCKILESKPTVSSNKDIRTE